MRHEQRINSTFKLKAGQSEKKSTLNLTNGINVTYYLLMFHLSGLKLTQTLLFADGDDFS